MKIRTLCILLKILKDYHELLVTSKTKANHFWIACFTKEEFLSMMPSHARISAAHEESMPPYKVVLDLVEKEERIIEYMIGKLEAMLPKQRQYLTSALVREALNQLGLQSHYLFEKNECNYDDYDISNIMAIFRKAGWVHQIWAFFDSDVESDEAYEITSLPSIYYDTSTEAEEMFEVLVNEGYFKDSEIKVLKSECIINLNQL